MEKKTLSLKIKNNFQKNSQTFFLWSTPPQKKEKKKENNRENLQMNLEDEYKNHKTTFF